MNIEEICKKKIKRFEDERDALVAKLEETQKGLSLLKPQLREARDAYNEATKQPTVTDHAVIRYLERVYGFDFEKQREELLTSSVLAAMNIGATGVKCDGYRLVLKGKTVVTII